MDRSLSGQLSARTRGLTLNRQEQTRAFGRVSVRLKMRAFAAKAERDQPRILWPMGLFRPFLISPK